MYDFYIIFRVCGFSSIFNANKDNVLLLFNLSKHNIYSNRFYHNEISCLLVIQFVGTTHRNIFPA